ncbi:MAG: ABC transporter ATP-binding protein [Desulfobacterales bacterium]|nr:ABC transporter ATP-binding protein [Desulfobacterales bacterium]
MEIRISRLSKDFASEGKRIHALAKVDLTIPANQIFTLLGPSGCGKTTLLRCIVGLEAPDEGEITIGGEVVWSGARGVFVPPEKRGLGMVFQTYAIWPHMTVFENVAYPLQARKRPREEIRRMVMRTLERVQLVGFENRPATKLSGGQQQRVALARALAAEPKVILFDEPLSNLDAKLREETRKELRRFLTELKITAVYVTHDRVEALSLSDAIAVMKDGRIVEIGDPHKIYFDSDHRFVADFIGRANLIDGRVAAQEGAHTRVDSVIGPIACQLRPQLVAGSPVAVCIRPEFIRVAAWAQDTEGGANRFRGRLESLVFVGEAYEGEIRVGDQRLIARIHPAAALVEGVEVEFAVEPEHCLALSH